MRSRICRLNWYRVHGYCERKRCELACNLQVQLSRFLASWKLLVVHVLKCDLVIILFISPKWGTEFFYVKTNNAFLVTTLKWLLTWNCLHLYLFMLFKLWIRFLYVPSWLLSHSTLHCQYQDTLQISSSMELLLVVIESLEPENHREKTILVRHLKFKLYICI